MRAVQGPATGLVAQVLLLAVITATVGVTGAGAVVGAACAVTLDAALARGLLRNPSERLGPAGWVTLGRATLVIGVAALTADSFERDVPVAMLVTLATMALVLDYVDGWVARRTASTSALGARLDGEVDAFLILVLSVYVPRRSGAWVLAIGAARYVFLVAGWLLRWMRAPLPRRDWRKVVAATQGITLTIAAAGVVPPRSDAGGPRRRARPARRVVRPRRLVALAQPACRRLRPDGHRGSRPCGPPWRHAARPPRGVGRARGSEPAQPRHTRAFVRVPLEGIVVIALALVLPGTGRRLLAWVVGPALGLLVIVKLLDFGFFTAFDRPFNPIDDWRYTSIGIETLRASIGRTDANLALIGVALLIVSRSSSRPWPCFA